MKTLGAEENFDFLNRSECIPIHTALLVNPLVREGFINATSAKFLNADPTTPFHSMERGIRRWGWGMLKSTPMWGGVAAGAWGQAVDFTMP